MFRLDVEYPAAWAAAVPGEVQDKIDLLADPYRDVFPDRRTAIRRREFWLGVGASATVHPSNPVTWPSAVTP